MIRGLGITREVAEGKVEGVGGWQGTLVCDRRAGDHRRGGGGSGRAKVG